MIWFNYFINFLEGLILSSFVAFYFNEKNKLAFIAPVSLACFLEITISNYFNAFDEFVYFAIILTLFVSLYPNKQSTNFEKVFICTMTLIFIHLSNLLSILGTTFFLGKTTAELYANNHDFVIAILLSKFILLVMLILVYKFQIKLSNRLTFKNGWTLLLLCMTIMYIITILMETLFTGVFTSKMAITVTIALVINLVLFFVICGQLQIENENNLKYELQLQKNKFSSENLDKIRILSNEVIETEHRMTYILMQIKNYIDTKQYDIASSTIERYFMKVKKFSSAIHTNNPYFDFVLASKINEYNYEDILLKNSLFIQEHELYNSKEFCDLVVSILDLFKAHLKSKKGLSLEIRQEKNFVVIKVLGNINRLEISENIFKQFEYFQADYSWDHIEDIYTLKFIIEI